MAPNIKAVPTSEYDAVVAVVNTYVDGLREGSSSKVSEAFHKDATMFGFTKGELLSGPIQNLYDFVDQYGKAPNIKVRLDVLAITQTTAVVRVDMEKDAANIDYTDFHTLLKQGGRWKIIAKTFHAYDS